MISGYVLLGVVFLVIALIYFCIWFIIVEMVIKKIEKGHEEVSSHIIKSKKQGLLNLWHNFGVVIVEDKNMLGYDINNPVALFLDLQSVHIQEQVDILLGLDDF